MPVLSTTASRPALPAFSMPHCKSSAEMIHALNSNWRATKTGLHRVHADCRSNASDLEGGRRLHRDNVRVRAAGPVTTMSSRCSEALILMQTHTQLQQLGGHAVHPSHRCYAVYFSQRTLCNCNTLADYGLSDSGSDGSACTAPLR